ncbi:MAG: tetratricopeptide repeat protein [Candidatus Melainabacteria bacterium]|nr:tetratricopeptide repeat protein [Candidatus Melainabacteria bacterium]
MQETDRQKEARKRWEIFKTAGQQAQMQGQIVQSELSWLSSLEEAETLGENSQQLVISLEGLSEVYWGQSKYAMAAPLCRRLLRIYETTLGADHMDVAVIANNLAMLYHSWKKHEDAERFYRQALAIKQQHLPESHPDLVNLLASYARLLYETNRKEEADMLKTTSAALSQTWKRSGSWTAMK